MSGYLDYSGRDDVLRGGARMIAVRHAGGEYQVWVKRVGNNPRLRVLLLHGGPGATHEYLEACDSYLPGAGIEYYYYDQLGSGYSDQPEDPSLWDARPLRRRGRAGPPWRSGWTGTTSSCSATPGAGILAIEYALASPAAPRGLVISNMMSSVPAYNAYAEQVLMPQMDQAALAEIKALEASGDIDNPRYMELLIEQHYVHHVLRMPSRTGPTRSCAASPTSTRRSTCRCRGRASWASARTPACALGPHRGPGPIEVPTLVIGAQHDTMDPATCAMMAGRLPQGRYLHCPDGSHMAMYDDQAAYFGGLIEFLHGLEG